MFRRIALKLDSVHKSKIALGSADVFSDLLFEDFRTGKLHFVAKSLEENELDLRFWLEIDRVEIEDVGFDGERVRAKGGTHADVGDGIEGFCVNRHLGDIDADLRDQLVVTAEVDGWNGVLVPIAAATAGVGDDAEGSSKDMAGARHFSGLDQAASIAAGEDVPTVLHGLIHHHLETEPAAIFLQAFDVALLLVSEVEVESLVDFDGVESGGEDLFGEFEGRHHGEVA